MEQNFSAVLCLSLNANTPLPEVFLGREQQAPQSNKVEEDIYLFVLKDKSDDASYFPLNN